MPKSPSTDCVISQVPLIEELLGPHEQALGTRYPGYRAHAYRMFHWMTRLAPDSAGRDERIAIMAALHDLPVLLDWDLVYVDRAADLATAYLSGIGRSDWVEEMRLMITNHHKMRPYNGPYRDMVEAARKADWIDVTLARRTFGLPRDYVRAVAAAFPMDGLYPWPVWGRIARYAITHPRRPMPMVRW